MQVDGFIIDSVFIVTGRAVYESYSRPFRRAVFSTSLALARSLSLLCSVCLHTLNKSALLNNSLILSSVFMCTHCNGGQSVTAVAAVFMKLNQLPSRPVWLWENFLWSQRSERPSSSPHLTKWWPGLPPSLFVASLVPFLFFRLGKLRLQMNGFVITSCISDPGAACKPNETSGKDAVQVGRSQRKTGSAKRRRRERQRGDVIRGNETERERESWQRDTWRKGERKAGILKAAVTPVTSHLSNPVPT